MDISELMKLLKHESLYGGAYGVNAKQVEREREGERERENESHTHTRGHSFAKQGSSGNKHFSFKILRRLRGFPLKYF